MIRAVLDTNVLASGLVRSNPSAATVQILDLWRSGTYTLLFSAHILAELERTLHSLYFSSRLTSTQIANVLALIIEQGRLVEVTYPVTGVATHPEDDIVLATAVSGDADYLVTGDRQLLKVATFRDVDIVSASAFRDLLTR